MVLAELGSKITAALQVATKSTIIDDKVVDELIQSICKALLEADVHVGLVKALRTAAKSKLGLDTIPLYADKCKWIRKTIVVELLTILDPGVTPFVPRKGKLSVVMFVGLQGAGKTTSCTKYALWYKKRGWKVAMVCADTFRPGAFDQLKQNATKCGIPCYGSYTESDPAVVAEAGVDKFKEEGMDMIIVDTSGRHKQQTALLEEMQQVVKATQPNEIVFVMDSSIGQAAKEQAQAFRDAVAVGSVIVTKLDGHARGGGALSAVAATKSPIVFVGTGEHMEDLEPFQAKSFVSRLLGMGDVDGLVAALSEESVVEKQKSSALANKMMQKDGAAFGFRDMKEQLQILMDTGLASVIMSKLPGFSGKSGKAVGGDGGGEGKGEAGTTAGVETDTSVTSKIKKYMILMDSMTDKELDSDGKLFHKEPTRITRVANGSGTESAIVHELIQSFKPFEAVLGMMRKGMGVKGGVQDAIAPGLGRGTGIDDGSDSHALPDRKTMMRAIRGGGGRGGGHRGNGQAGMIASMMKQLQSRGGGRGGGGKRGVGGISMDAMMKAMTSMSEL